MIAFAAPDYEHTAIAVTRNFVGSPHIDHFDRTSQLAVALGDFEGGELCVDEDVPGGGSDVGDGSGTGMGGRALLRRTVALVDTRKRVARVDGRCVHWVRDFRGAERFSLIFYNTNERQPEPIGPAVQPL